MSVVKINVLTVPQERREVLEERFAGRAGDVDSAPGFERFQLLRPTDDSDEYFVVTQWESDEAFRAWMDSQSFARSHGSDQDAGTTAGDDASADGDTDPRDGGARPAATGAILRAFEVVEEA